MAAIMVPNIVIPPVNAARRLIEPMENGSHHSRGQVESE